MKRFITLMLLLAIWITLPGQDVKTVTITYGMNKTLPPTYTFKANFTGEPARISWDFGDKSFSDEVSPTHLFPVSGVYIVQVKLLDAQGTVYYGKLEDKFEGKEPVTSPGIISGKGKVKDLSAIAGCRLAIVLENGTTLLPVEILPEFILKEGQMVTFAYELLGAATACQAGKAVKIHRISLVEETPPVLYGKGSVIDKSAVAGCGLLIVLDDGRVLIPVEVIPNFLLKEGQRVELVWEPLRVATTCMTGVPVRILKIAEITVVPALPVCPGALSLVLYDPVNPGDCDGKAVVSLLDENGTEYSAVKYTWSNGNAGNTAINLCRDKTYVVQSLIEGKCQKTTSFAFLSKPQWRVSAVGDKFNFSVVSPVNDVVYRWDFGDGKTAYGSNVDYSFSSDGVYKVTLTAISGNSTADASQEITAMKSTTPATIIGNRNFSLYPNPVKEVLYIRHDGQISAELILEISDIKGQVVFQEKYTTGMEQLTALPVSHLPDGMYLLRMISDNQPLPVRKFIKRN